MGGSQVRYDSEGFPDENGKYDSDGFPVENTGMSAKDSSDIKKIMSTNEKTDDVTDYQNADQAERDLASYRNEQLMQITDPVQKSLAEQQFNLAMKQHTDSKAEMLKRDPNLPYKVAAQSDDPEVLINAYAKQQGISLDEAKSEFAQGPANLRAKLRGGNPLQLAAASTKDIFTSPLRLVKGVGGTAYDIASNKDSDFLKNVSDPRGLSGSIANDPSILPSLAIPGAGGVRLASILGKGAVKGLAPEIARQGLDLASGESTGPEYGNLALSSLGGVAGEGIGALRAVNKTRAGQNILGAEGSNLNDLIGFSEDATKANIKKAKGKILQEIPAPYTVMTKPGPVGMALLGETKLDPNDIVRNHLDELARARKGYNLPYEEYKQHEAAIGELKDRLATVAGDDHGVELEYKAWLAAHPEAATKAGMLNMENDLKRAKVQDRFAAMKGVDPDIAFKPSKQLLESMANSPYARGAQETLSLKYGGKSTPEIGRGLAEKLWGLRNESPMGYQLSDILLNTSERATRTAPQVQKRDKPAAKLRDNSKQMQSLSDLIKGKK